MLARWGIRLGSSLAGIAVGLLLGSILLSSMTISVAALVEATVIFFGVNFVVQIMALRVLVRQPSVALAALFIVNLIVSGLHFGGIGSYVGAALLVWLGMAAGDAFGDRKLRDRREAKN